MTGAQSDLHQLEQIEQLGRGPNGAYTLTVPPRPRGLVSQVTMVLVRPGEFFDSLAIMRGSRQWVWIAAVVLVVVGLSAVRYQSASKQVADGDQVLGGDLSGVPVDPFGGGGVVVESGLDTGFPDAGVPSGGAASSGEDVTGNWTTALIASSNVLVAWGILAVLFGVVSLMNGRAPRFGHNVQVAVWASVPLGLMAGLQMIYFLMGGSAGASGLSGLLAEWSGYSSLSEPAQRMAVSAAERLTLFSLWALALAYIGGRHALRGRWWVVLPVVVAWAAIIVVLPVLAGTVDLPQSEDVVQGDGTEMLDPSMTDGGITTEPGIDGALPEEFDPLAVTEAPGAETINPEGDSSPGASGSDAAPLEQDEAQPPASGDEASSVQPAAPITKGPQ